jgi:hypothetical protein
MNHSLPEGITMYALRQIIDLAPDMIAVPEPMRHQRVEVIFMALDDNPSPGSQPLAGDTLLDFFKKVPPAQCPEEELYIEPRSHQPDRAVDLE